MDAPDGELHQQGLHHQKDDIRAFYSQFSGDVIVGLEAGGYSGWFEQLLDDLGRQVLIGDAARIGRLARRRQKSDHRDADPILGLLHRGEFPRLHRPPAQSLEVMRQLRYRHRMVKLRTTAKISGWRLRAKSVRKNSPDAHPLLHRCNTSGARGLLGGAIVVCLLINLLAARDLKKTRQT